MKNLFKSFLPIIIFMGIVNYSYSQITTASNGLTATGTAPTKDVSLGGTLTGNTNLTLSGSFFSVDGSASKLAVNASGYVGIATTAPGEALDIVSNRMLVGADKVAGLTNVGTRTFAPTEKVFISLMSQYSGAHSPWVISEAYSSPTDNNLWFGGGTQVGHSATKIVFYTAPDNHTLGGTPQMLINESGNMGFGPSAVTTPTARFHFDCNGAFTATKSNFRMQSLTTNSTALQKLLIDANGYVYASTASGTCNTVGYIPVTNATNGDVVCSQITDNATTVQIGTGNVGTVSWNGTFGGELSQNGVVTGSYTNSSGPYTLFVGGGGLVGATAYIATSDQRLKKNIKKIDSPIQKIIKISGYTYDWNTGVKTGRKLDNKRQAGFLAQEIEKVLPEAVVINSDGFYGLNYNAIMPLLSEGIKQQQTEIESLKLKIEELQNKINQLVPGNVKIRTDDFKIVPNPLTNSSVITFKLESTLAKSSFVIYDLQGKMLQQINIPSNVKEGQVKLDKKGLAKGMYIVSLIAENTEIQSKRVLISE